MKSMELAADNSNSSQKSLKKNTFFNFLLSGSSILFPLITTPYISRVLNIEDIGIINQGAVFSNLFINLISLGLSGYGAREIARVRDDKKKLNEVFFSVILLHFIAFIIGALFYLGFTFFFVDEQRLKKIYLIYFFLLFSNPFMIEWFYTGLEEFRYISVRSILIKVLMFVMLFVFVRTSKDFFHYAILLVGAQSLNSIFNILHAGKYINFKFIKFSLKHILFGAKYFYFQTLVAICYQNINQLVLGNNDKVQLALYVRATTLAALISSCTTPIMNAVKPRLEHIISADKNRYESCIDKCFNCVMVLLFPICFGIAALSSNIMLIFGGEQFSLGGAVLKTVAFSALVSNFSVFLNNIISTPAGFEKNTLFGNVSVAFFSLVLNPVLISQSGAKGAALAMLLAESSGVVIQLLFIKRQKLYLKFINYKLLKYFISAAFMYFLVEFLCTQIQSNFLAFFVCILSGATVYLLVFLIFDIVFKDKNDVIISSLYKFISRGGK